MKKSAIKSILIFYALFIIFLAGLVVAQADQRSYDKHRYEYKRPPTVTFYDKNGRYMGRRDPDGTLYNSSGNYKGRDNKSNGLYDSSGAYIGRKDGARR